MSLELLNKETHNALTEFAKSRICIMSDMGTGNLLRYDNRLFIATCRHVAEDYFHANRPYVSLRKNIRIPSQELEPISHTNKHIDIALIEVIGDYGDIVAYEVDNFEMIQDFSSHSFEEANLFICGFPKDLRYEREEGFYNVWMSYMTLPDGEVDHTEDFIYASYQIQKDDNLTSEGLRTLLPKAPGLSGAFVLKVTPFEVHSPELWTPSYAKVIAMQTTWNQGTWIKASNIKYLFALLDQLAST